MQIEHHPTHLHRALVSLHSAGEAELLLPFAHNLPQRVAIILGIRETYIPASELEHFFDPDLPVPPEAVVMSQHRLLRAENHFHVETLRIHHRSKTETADTATVECVPSPPKPHHDVHLIAHIADTIHDYLVSCRPNN